MFPSRPVAVAKYGPKDDSFGRGYGTSEPSAPSGSVRAMAVDVLAEWRLAQTSGVFRSWLEQGARSDDAEGSGRCRDKQSGACEAP